MEKTLVGETEEGRKEGWKEGRKRGRKRGWNEGRKGRRELLEKYTVITSNYRYCINISDSYNLSKTPLRLVKVQKTL